MEWPSFSDAYEKLVRRMNTPRVVVDNDVCPTATLIKVDSARKRGILLEAVQILIDLNLTIKKAYISSDGRWFMDVFHVTDQFGQKITDERSLSYIQQSLSAGNDARPGCLDDLTVLELAGTDRPGLLSEVFAVLAEMQCSVVEAKVWTHNGRIASLIQVKDEDSGSSLVDSQRIHFLEGRLSNVVRGDADDALASARITAVSSTSVTHADRRLHQIMFAHRDYEQTTTENSPGSQSAPSISVQNWIDRGYSIVNVQCRDRPKLLFDIVCTLTDMEYVVFHGTIDTEGDRAHQVRRSCVQPHRSASYLVRNTLRFHLTHLPDERLSPGILHPACRREPHQLGGGKAARDPVFASGNRAEGIRRGEAGALRGGQAGPPVGGHPDLPGERAVGDEGGGLHQERDGLQRVLRHRLLGASCGPQADRGRPAADRPGEPQGAGDAAGDGRIPEVELVVGTEGGEQWGRRPFLPGQPGQEESLQPGAHQILLLVKTRRRRRGWWALYTKPAHSFLPSSRLGL